MFEVPEWWFKNEAKFTTWFWRKCKDKGYFFFKISDSDLRLKPADAIMQADGQSFLIEFKAISAKTYFYPYRLLSWSKPSKPWSQVLGLSDFEKNGWNSLIIVYNKVTNEYYILRFSEVDFNTKFYVRC